MKARLAELIGALRRNAVTVSVAEAIDAAQAAAVAGLERATLRDALAATLVKDERDRPIFEREFARVFPARPADLPGRAGRKRNAGADAGGGATGAGTAGAGGARSASATAVTSRDAPRQRARVPHDAEPDRHPDATVGRAPEHAAAPERTPAEPRRAGAGALAARSPDARSEHARVDAEAGLRAQRLSERALLALPFREMSARDVEEASDLVRALARRFRARMRRRLRPRARGRLDFRRTIRAAIPRGGVPFERFYRGRRPGRLDLVALCDLSASTAIASEFFLALLAPAAEHFAHVRLFGFVDHPVEIEFVDGQVRPAGALDLMARSDFGHVLVELMAGLGAELTANTLLLVLGDARNNRRPPRADLLAAARARVRRLLWLNPEPLERWNTGDSVIATYARHADAVLSCGSLAELERALAAVARL